MNFDPENPNNLPIKRMSVIGLVAAYQQTEKQIREAFHHMEEAKRIFKEAFIRDINPMQDGGRHMYRDADESMASVKLTAWDALVDKMELRRVMSIKRARELDEQIRTGKDLPEITEVNILAMMENSLGSTRQFMAEAVQEVYDWLRPYHHNVDSIRHVTNQKNRWSLGKKVIKEYALDSKYGGGFQVVYTQRANFTALDNVFHLMDGKGTIKTYQGPLCDAIQKTETATGETDYFKFKCYGNQNLHLEFKRMDLVDKFNAIAGGNRLPNAE